MPERAVGLSGGTEVVAAVYLCSALLESSDWRCRILLISLSRCDSTAALSTFNQEAVVSTGGFQEEIQTHSALRRRVSPAEKSNGMASPASVNGCTAFPIPSISEACAGSRANRTSAEPPKPALSTN